VTRRSAVFGIAIRLAPQALADERTDALEAVSPLATALSNGNADDFMRRIPDDAPNRSQLSDNIRALTGQAEMTCSIKLNSYEQGRAEFDWYMEIRSRATSSVLERRRENVVVHVRSKEILSIEPVAFFRPAAVR
jgi:hypothetical protein